VEAPKFVRVKKSGSHEYLQIVENRRVEGRALHDTHPVQLALLSFAATPWRETARGIREAYIPQFQDGKRQNFSLWCPLAIRSGIR
jgi:hypothetical protein